LVLVLPADTTGQAAVVVAVLFLIDHSQLLQEHLMQLQLVMALDNTILVGQVLGVPLLLQQTVRTLCFQLSPPAAAVEVDRGNRLLLQVWTMVELVAAVVPVAAAAQIQATVLTVDSVTMVVWALTVKVSPEVRVLDLMWIQKILTKVVVVVVLAALVQVLLMVVRDIVHHLEAIKLPEVLVLQQIY
jgi:hypothetical protein